MRALFTADIHLSDRPQDEYRWSIFKHLRRLSEDRKCNHLVIAGDLTEKKDNHSADLVNRLVNELHGFPGMVYIIAGNHDYSTTVDRSYFRFLNGLENVRFYTKPSAVRIGGDRQYLDTLLLPHSLHPKADWKKYDPADYNFIVLHQTIKGAETESGRVIGQGIPCKWFSKDKTNAVVIAGDIHQPQKVGNVTYCGAPHPVDFGDNYQPRILFWNETKLESIKINTVRKIVIQVHDVEGIKSADLRPLDQVRIFAKIKRTDFHKWFSIRDAMIAAVEETKATLAGIEMIESDQIVVRAETVDTGSSESLDPYRVLNLHFDQNKTTKRVRKTAKRILKELK